MLPGSMTQVGTWSRRIGGALVLTLVGLLAPAPTSAVMDDGNEEVIYIEDEAPLAPPTWGGYTGSGAGPSGPSDGGGGGDGGETSPSSESRPAPPEDCAQFPPASEDSFYCLARQIEYDCVQVFGGTYSWEKYIELDPNGEEEHIAFFGLCYIENRHGWTQAWYDPENGSADPVKICTGRLHRPGTCWEP